MISAEAPVLFAKAAEIFITEISLRAWIHTEDNKRRTLQRNDIAMAITKYDQFDFLIDIVPRDELKPVKRQQAPGTPGVGTVSLSDASGNSVHPEQVQYYLQLAQQAALQQAGPGQQIQILQAQNSLQGVPAGFTIANQQQLVQVQVPNSAQANSVQASNDNGQTVNSSQQAAPSNQGQIIQLQNAANAGQGTQYS